MPKATDWTRDQFLLALRLYMRTPVAQRQTPGQEPRHHCVRQKDRPLLNPEGMTANSPGRRLCGALGADARRVQSFFRAAVLISYDQRCAVTGIAIPELLTASHIIPWSAAIDKRADPCNGLCLSALIDRAFDRGLLTFDVDFSVVLSKRLKDGATAADFDCSLLAIEGRKLRMPGRFLPAKDALEWHRERVFAG